MKMSDSPGFRDNCIFCKIAQKIQRKSHHIFQKNPYSKAKSCLFKIARQGLKNETQTCA